MQEERLSGSSMTRRNLIAAIGAAGAAAAAAAIWPAAVEAAVVPASQLFYNVKDFGAKGTGRYSNDDTAPIQSAIDAAAQSGGGIVVFPAGTYTVTSTLYIKSDVQLLGGGAGVSTLRAADDSFIMLAALGNLESFSVEQLTFEGLGVPSPSQYFLGMERSIHIEGGRNGRIADCEFKRTTIGVSLSKCISITVSNCSFQNIVGGDNRYEGFGVSCQGGGNLMIAGNRFNNVYRSCIQLTDGCSTSSITDNIAENGQTAAIQLVSSGSACANNIIARNMIGTVTEKDAAVQTFPYGISISDYCTGNLIEGNLIAASAKAGIKLEAAPSAETERPSGNKISNNIIKNAPTGVLIINSDDSSMTGNEISRVEKGIAIDTTGEGFGSYSRRNFAVNNGISFCSVMGVSIENARCEVNGVFGNYGSNNTDYVADNGSGTLRVSF
jgi:hypothetical protein